MALVSHFSTAVDPELALQAEVAALNRQFEGADAQTVLREVIEEQYVDEIALVSSFGADSAVLLHMVSQINPDVPVVFVDTGKLFPATLRYRDELVTRFGFSDVRSQRPLKNDLASEDPAGMLWMSDTDACCHIRKVLPLEHALDGFAAWISGRKRFQSSKRSTLELFETENDRIKVNPLASWSAQDILAYAKELELPPHPLVAEGYPSIGCLPCTDKVKPGEDPRAGRWRGQEKTECGIHLPTHGREIDGSGI